VFDNRSMALLSLFLLMRRQPEAPYGAVLRERAYRLLLPYLAWTLIYPFLDLAVAAIAGRPELALGRILDAQFWLSGILWATVTGHLHFLPTLFILTLLLPFYRTRLSIWAAVALLGLASAVRTIIEFFLLHRGDVAPTLALAALSAARIVEYLPLGFLAFAIASAPPSRSGHRTAAAIVVLGLLAASIGLQPDWFTFAGPSASLLAWTISQAILGAVIVSLAAQALLASPAASQRRSDLAARLGLGFQQRALGMFLIHPFFCDLFDAIVTAPRAFDLAMVLPKFAFVLACSFFASSFLISSPRLAPIV
jgi:fucose 4-O-acetylase-like acetyltransferase